MLTPQMVVLDVTVKFSKVETFALMRLLLLTATVNYKNLLSSGNQISQI